MNVEDIARICHEANRAICEANQDHTQMTWDNAEQWQRDSAIAGVKGFDPDGTSSSQHDLWCKHKVDDGWKYGEVKDSGLKTHPCLVPYDELPFADKVKDYVFRGIVSACLNIE